MIFKGFWWLEIIIAPRGVLGKPNFIPCSQLLTARFKSRGNILRPVQHQGTKCEDTMVSAKKPLVFGAQKTESFLGFA